MLNTNFPPWPCFTAEEGDAVRTVLLSNRVNYWTGVQCREFEREFSQWCGTTYAVAVSNGTLALDLALTTLGVGAGDEVIVTPRTFIASVSTVVNRGATPVFADVDINSGNLSAATIAAVLTPRTKAIICVHLAGFPCDMDPIIDLARCHGLYVIEDCAQAHGARYKGRSVGAIGDIGAWSFCQDKIMSTGGEGGMITLNSEELWQKAWAYKDHGKSYQAVYQREHPPGFRWLHDSFGTNWRMMEMQAVIGRIQLKRMKQWTESRKVHSERIWRECSKFPALRAPSLDAHNGSVHANYKCYVYLNKSKISHDWSRDKIIAAIGKLGVPCYQGTCSEVYLENAFNGTDWRPKQRLPNAKELGETSLMFLVHPSLSTEHIEMTCNAINSVFSRISQERHEAGNFIK